MALSLLSYPANDCSVSNEMIFAISETTKTADPVTYPNYKFVLDVYVAGDLVGRLKANPHPTTLLGIFDVSRVLQYYVPAYGLKANYASATETYPLSVTYHVELGEEYSDTTYTNLVTDSDRTCYKTYAERPYLSSSVIDNKVGLVCSNMPASLTGYKDDKWQIIPFFDNVSGATVSYNFDDGTSIIGGAGSQTYTPGGSAFQVNLGFVKVAAELGLTSAQQAQVTGMQFDYDNSQVYRINYGSCKYPTVVLAWLNPYGAYESYSFGMVSKKTKEISRKEYERLPYEVNASGVLSYDSDGVLYGGKRTYNTRSKTMVNLNSHILTDSEYSWLADLFQSSDVYMYDGTLDRFIPVRISDSNYEYRTYLNSRLVPLNFTIEYADSFNSQYL